MTSHSPINEVVRETLREVLAAPEFVGREPHWLTQLSLWFRSIWEHATLAVARLAASLGGGGGSLPEWVGGLAFVGIVVAVYFAIGRVRGLFVREIKSLDTGSMRVPEESYRRLRQKATRSLARGASFKALRKAYLAGLRLLWEKDLLPHSVARTDREFLVALGTHPARKPFGQLSSVFSKHRYGLLRTGNEEARVALQLLDQLHVLVDVRGRHDEAPSTAKQAGGLG